MALIIVTEDPCRSTSKTQQKHKTQDVKTLIETASMNVTPKFDINSKSTFKQSNHQQIS